jgi:hypothetical protein
MSFALSFGIASWFVDMLREAKRDSILPLAFILLIISTSVGVSGKTTMLTIPAILILAFIGRGQGVGSSSGLPVYSNDGLSVIRRETAGVHGLMPINVSRKPPTRAV